jgi:hypothetical protein
LMPGEFDGEDGDTNNYRPRSKEGVGRN